MKKPTNPVERMRELDEEGTAYTLDNVKLISGEALHDLAVFSHSDRWLHVQATNEAASLWVRVDSIVHMTISEH